MGDIHVVKDHPDSKIIIRELGVGLAAIVPWPEVVIARGTEGEVKVAALTTIGVTPTTLLSMAVEMTTEDGIEVTEMEGEMETKGVTSGTIGVGASTVVVLAERSEVMDETEAVAAEGLEIADRRPKMHQAYCLIFARKLAPVTLKSVIVPVILWI